MEFTTNHSCTKCAMRSDLATALCYPERVLLLPTVDVSAKIQSFETRLLEPGNMIDKETGP